MVLPGFQWILMLMLQINTPAVFCPGSFAGQSGPAAFTHPFYVSVTELNHNLKDKTIEISCKMFAEDFEGALKTIYKTNVDLTHPKDPKLVEKYFNDYLQKHLQLKINGKPVTLVFVGFEKEDEAVWAYLQVNNIPQAKKIEIMNNILYESYNTQISIMHAAVAGSRKSTRLVYPDTQASFDFND